MAFYPLKLAVNPEGWRAFNARKKNPQFKPYIEKVLKRDRETCQFCGFQAKIYQEIVNLDQNYRNNKLANLVTACCFCTQCCFLESVGSGEYGGGTLLYYPELSQNELNGLCHVLFCAMVNDTDYQLTAQGLYRSLKMRSQPVEEQFGSGTSNPAVLAQLLIETGLRGTPMQEAALKDLRLLPSRARFRVQLQAWGGATTVAASAGEEE